LRGLNKDCKLQAAVNYVAEYSGVMGAVIADREGLVIVCSPPGLKNGELYAALGLDIIRNADGSVGKLIDPGSRHVSVKTKDRWFTVAATLNFLLIVLADKKADDLLNVRIQRTLDMIANHVKDKYPAEVYSDMPGEVKKEITMEASHV